MAQKIIQIIRIVATNDRGLRIGQYHHNCKYPDSIVDQMREMHEAQRMTFRGISEAMNIPINTVRKICCYQRRAQTYAKWKKIEG